MSACRRSSGMAGAIDIVGQALRSPSRTRPFDTTHIARSRLAPRPIPFIPRRTYAHAAQKPLDADHETEGPGSRAFTPNPRDDGGGKMSRDEQAKWAFPTKANPSPYDVLHLPVSASKGDIKKHYYRLAMLYHPDSSHPSSSTDNFMALRNAYNLLNNDSSRSLYNRTGIGWSSTSPSSASSSGRTGFRDGDEMMRDEIRNRARHWGNPHAYGYAYGRGSARGEAGYNQARWGNNGDGYSAGFAGAGNGNPNGNYTSNYRFVSSVMVFSVIFGIFQYERASRSAQWHKDLVERNHQKASDALAEARTDAALYGKERRERIRRYVRSLEVEKEYARMLAEGGEPTHMEHGGGGDVKGGEGV